MTTPLDFGPFLTEFNPTLGSRTVTAVSNTAEDFVLRLPHSIVRQ